MQPLERGVSESSAIAVLIAITVLATASVGLTALFAGGDQSADDSRFDVEFQFSSNLAQLTVFPANDEPVRAGNVVIDGPDKNVTWAELGDLGTEDTVEDGGQPVFVSDSSAYGSEIGEEDTVYVVWNPPDERSVTIAWNEGEGEEGGDGAPTTPGGGPGPEVESALTP